MAKQVSKKSAKTAKAAATDAEGKKKKRKASRQETYTTYIYKVLKQVHPKAATGTGGKWRAALAVVCDPAPTRHVFCVQPWVPARRPCPS